MRRGRLRHWWVAFTSIARQIVLVVGDLGSQMTSNDYLCSSRGVACPARRATNDARELDVQYLLGHSSPDMVRRYASTYNCEQAARRHASFSPADALSMVRP